MRKIRVKDIISMCNAKVLCGDEEEILENFKKDTNEIEKGDTYVGIQGEKVNGSIFFEKAFENGAKACILNNIEIKEEILEKYKDRIIIIVENTIRALQEIATYKREGYDIPIVRSYWKCWKN